MRNIVTISLPPSIKKNVEKIIKEENYASMSEFFRDAYRVWENNRLVRELKDSQREIASGKGKVLKSLSDLD